ncbi:MAG: GNAT family N-acetyltransferase [Bacteroidetes bacterium 4572_117]|nr:MAG: GNAT family N-acetyltransferase [Bacteroidetes bacterium 4572_117]
MNNIVIKKIEFSDNQELAIVVRKVLTEFGGNRPNTAYFDYDTDHMFEAYQGKNEVYFVAKVDGELVGGSGIKILAGNSGEICELQKLYINSNIRGLGIGKILVQKCLDFAKEAGYKKCYLETFPNMDAAINLYKKFGFLHLEKPIGDTGHGGCDVWMIKEL